ncbi:MAG: ATP-binding cassette domain-containing protein [Lentisphaerae bacterium]|nr:ATP-binding cassette domain-containing protein [Lentisphaerota bacterium]
MPEQRTKIEIGDLWVNYRRKPALRGVSLRIPANSVVGIIGPANAGKTTLLKAINRTLEFEPGVSLRGEVRVDGRDTRREWNVYDLRRRIGMVFPLPVGLPLSVYDNVAYAPRRAGIRGRRRLDGIVERCLRQAALWDEVKDRLNALGSLLSGGQQQRLTIARALSHDPEILCLDEFSIAIDPVTTMKIEDVLVGLKSRMTIVLVTNLVQQARRLADVTCFLNRGAVVQTDATEKMFSDDPGNRLTYDYIHGRFG